MSDADNTTATTTTTTVDTTTVGTTTGTDDLITSLFNTWHDLRTAATKEIADFETYKQEIESEFQRRSDIITVRNARYNQLLFIIERIKLNIESTNADKPVLFPDITADPETMLTQAAEWLETDGSHAPEDLLKQLKAAQAAEAEKINAAATENLNKLSASTGTI